MARAAVQCAKWMTENGRQKCNELAGEKIKHHVSEPFDSYTEELVAKLVDPALTPVAPLFNIVSVIHSHFIA